MEGVKTITNAQSFAPAADKEVQKKEDDQSSTPLFYQPKLTIGSADDPLEKEADSMADKVMRMEMLSPLNFSSTKNSVNRKCAHCEEEEKQVQRKESRSDLISTAPSIVHDVINSSGGRYLDTATRSFMEPRFNYDFSNVKIHDSDLAAKSANSINALAYTSGNNVVFNSGQYNTNSDSGKRLLAHELTHVAQQNSRASGRSIMPSIQLQAKDDAGTIPLPTKEADPVTADAALPSKTPTVAGTATPTAVTQKTTPVTLTALYEDVPGESKDKDKRATGNAALWFDPLTMHSNYPDVKKSMRSVGVVSGGEQTVDTFQAPVTEDEQHIGQGSISAELKYAGTRNKSFNVSVTGVQKKDVATAEKLARKVVEEEMSVFGDADEIASTATTKIKEVYPEAEVSISVKNDKVMDAGQSSFFYRVHNPAGILMNVQIAPVGQKNTEYIGTKTTERGTEDMAAKKDKTTTETLDVAYNKSVVRTLDDYVSKLTTIHNELASDLAETVIEDKKANYEDVTQTKRRASNVSDYTRDLKQTVESGERDKENWAAKAQKVVKGVKKVTSIPFIDRIPGIGWLSRKVKGWQIDAIDWILGELAETGKVTYTDTKLDENAKKTDTIKDDTDVKREVELKEHNKVETKRKLVEDYKSTTKDEWERHKKDITDIRETYSSKYKKDESETETKHEERENQSTTATFKVSSTWKFTKPVIQATVVAGDAEVKNTPFAPTKSEEKNPPPVTGK